MPRRIDRAGTSRVAPVAPTRSHHTNAANTQGPLTGTGGVKGIVYDPIRNVLWVGTTGHETLVLGIDHLNVLARVPARGGADPLGVDPSPRLVYAFEGSVSGGDVHNADTVRAVGFVSTGSGNSHTGAIDLMNGRVCAHEGDANVVGMYTPFPAARPNRETRAIFAGRRAGHAEDSARHPARLARIAREDAPSRETRSRPLASARFTGGSASRTKQVASASANATPATACAAGGPPPPASRRSDRCDARPGAPLFL